MKKTQHLQSHILILRGPTPGRDHLRAIDMLRIRYRLSEWVNFNDTNTISSLLPDLLIVDCSRTENITFLLRHLRSADHHPPVIICRDSRVKIPLEWLTELYLLRVEILDEQADDYVEVLLWLVARILKRQGWMERRNHADSTYPQEQAISWSEKLQGTIIRHLLDADFNVQKLAFLIGMSRTALFYQTKNILGVSPSEVIFNYRIKGTAYLLKNSRENIGAIGYAMGFSTPSHFAHRFREVYGVSPTAFRKQKCTTERASLPPIIQKWPHQPYPEPNAVAMHCKYHINKRSPEPGKEAL